MRESRDRERAIDTVKTERRRERETERKTEREGRQVPLNMSFA